METGAVQQIRTLPVSAATHHTIFIYSVNFSLFMIWSKIITNIV
jgi:hypothetical protein